MVNKTPFLNLDMPDETEFYSVDITNANAQKIDAGVKEAHDKAAETATQVGNIATNATHSKSGTVHSLTLGATPTEGIQLVQFVATADYTEGDTFSVGGVAYVAKLQGEDGTLSDKLFVAGDMVSVMLDPVGKKLGFKSGGKPPVPSIFGDGSDGDLYIADGETVVLPVLVPHQSVVEKQYKSVFIGVGATLKCSDPNAGLVIRCKGDFTCHGTIDQSLMAPKPNPNNTFVYPAELVPGDGGYGGKGGYLEPGDGGIGALATKFGGGYSAGGGSAGGYWGTPIHKGAPGGSANTITHTTPIDSLFKPGIYGGGANSHIDNANPIAGGSAARTAGGTGNFGGGVILMYCGGNASIDGFILCNGGNGGNGGDSYFDTGLVFGSGGGAGGAGGGAVYIVHNGTYVNSGMLSVNGGLGGAAGGGREANPKPLAGVSGTIGTVTIKKYEKGMTV